MRNLPVTDAAQADDTALSGPLQLFRDELEALQDAADLFRLRAEALVERKRSKKGTGAEGDARMIHGYMSTADTLDALRERSEAAS